MTHILAPCPLTRQSPTATLFGGAGFLGRATIEVLGRQGLTVRVPTRDITKAWPLRMLGNVGQIVPYPASLEPESALVEAIRGASVVVNFLGILNEKGSQTFQRVHVEKAAQLARIAREEGVSRFIHISALGADSASRSAYARSKAAGEEAVRAFFPEATILRPSVIYGPGDGFFQLFAGLARFSPVLPLVGGGATLFQPVYVRDVAAAIGTILSAPATQGRLYELGGPERYSFQRLLEILLTVTHQRRRLVTLPWSVATALSYVMEKLPQPLLTPDQVELLKHDAVTAPEAEGFAALGLTPRALETILPTYLGTKR